MTHPLMKRSRKPQCSRRWASHPTLMAFQQRPISTGEKQLSIFSRFCSPTDGERESTGGPQGCSHCFSVHNQGRKIRLFKLSRHYHALHCKQNLDSRLAEQAHPDDSTGKHARKPVWVQVQQTDRRNDLRAEADTGKTQRTEHRSLCSFRRPDHFRLRHSLVAVQGTSFFTLCSRSRLPHSLLTVHVFSPFTLQALSFISRGRVLAMLSRN